MKRVLLEKTYDGESIIDMARDVHEAIDSDFNPEVLSIPQDKYGIQQGTFRVVIEWTASNGEGV